MARPGHELVRRRAARASETRIRSRVAKAVGRFRLPRSSISRTGDCPALLTAAAPFVFDRSLPTMTESARPRRRHYVRATVAGRESPRVVDELEDRIRCFKEKLAEAVAVVGPLLLAHDPCKETDAEVARLCSQSGQSDPPEPLSASEWKHLRPQLRDLKQISDTIHDVVQDAIRRVLAAAHDDDIVEEGRSVIYCKFPNHLRKYEFRGPFLHYIRSIAKTTRLELQRRAFEEAKEERHEQPQDCPVVYVDEPAIFAREHVERLLTGYARRFPRNAARDLQILKLRFVLGFDHKEIGSKLGLSEGNARLIFLRILRRLREVESEGKS